MTSVFEVFSRQCRASSVRREPFFVAAALFDGAGLAASLAGSFEASGAGAGLSCAMAAAAKSAITKKARCFMDLSCFHETMA